MQREHNFAKSERFGQDICWHAAHPSKAPTTGTVATARQALINAGAALLCRFVAQPLARFNRHATAIGAPHEIRLEAHTLWSGTIASGTNILCRGGALWITRDGDPHDHILRTGQTLHISNRSQVVISAFAEGTTVRMQGKSRQ